MASKKKTPQSKTAEAKEEAAAGDRLPFEPVQTRSKPAKKPASSHLFPVKERPKSKSDASNIPEVVSRRMVRRAAIFCGVPTALALLTFVVSYYIVSQHLLKLPNVAVLLVSLGFFGLGVLGLSYGPLSASWDEERVGGLLGLAEFKLNFGRLRESSRAAKAAKEENSPPPA